MNKAKKIAAGVVGAGILCIRFATAQPSTHQSNIQPSSTTCNLLRLHRTEEILHF